MIKRLPWLRLRKKTAQEVPVRLPIAAGSITNGEGWWPDSPRKQLIRKLVLERADEISRRHGIDRREFLASSCGMATTLMVINMINGCDGSKAGGGFVTDPNGMATPLAGQPGTGTPPFMGTPPPGGTPGDAMPAGDAMTPPPPPPEPIAPPRGIDELCANDPSVADAMLGGNELVIDMQSHFATPETNPAGAGVLGGFIDRINVTNYPWLQRTPGVLGTGRYDRNEYVNQIIMGSDTSVGVLSGISYAVGNNGMGVNGFAVLSNEDLDGGAVYLNGLYPGRILKHCMVMPNDRIDVQLAMMERNAATFHNWKTYPPYQAGNRGGYWLNEGVGPMMIQKGLDLNLPIFCVHKGFPLNGFSAEHCSPRDVGPAARMFPDAIFVIYHSAFENGLAAGESTAPSTLWMGEVCGNGSDTQIAGGMWPEGPYDETDPAVQALYPLDRGVNSLIKSLRDSNIGPNGKDLDNPEGPVTTQVYAECGGVWPALITGRKEEAMHYWGKLLKHVGEDRLVWGTDCLWFGSPQPLIEAFRCFQISEDFQSRYGYPEMTQAIKEKILGQNARRLQNTHPDINIPECHNDAVAENQRKLKRELDEEFGRRRDMTADVYGPKSRREFLKLAEHENEEKDFWSGNVPPSQETSKHKAQA